MCTYKSFDDDFVANSKSTKRVFNDADLKDNQWRFHAKLNEEFFSRVGDLISELVDEFCDEYGVYLKPGVDAYEAIDVENPNLVFNWEYFDF